MNPLTSWILPLPRTPLPVPSSVIACYTFASYFSFFSLSFFLYIPSSHIVPLLLFSFLYSYVFLSLSKSSSPIPTSPSPLSLPAFPFPPLPRTPRLHGPSHKPAYETWRCYANAKAQSSQSSPSRLLSESRLTVRARESVNGK